MTFKRLAAVTAGVLVLTVSLAIAQGPAGGHRPGGDPVAMLSVTLSLTDSQKAAVQTIFDQAKQESQPIADQLKQEHETIAAAVKAQKSDAELATLATAQGKLMGQLAAIHVKAFSHVYALLTPEQRDKADQLHQQMSGMFGSHFGAR
jgi:protein CpxP